MLKEMESISTTGATDFRQDAERVIVLCVRYPLQTVPKTTIPNMLHWKLRLQAHEVNRRHYVKESDSTETVGRLIYFLMR
jgi:hypothetical protein